MNFSLCKSLRRRTTLDGQLTPWRRGAVIAMPKAHTPYAITWIPDDTLTSTNCTIVVRDAGDLKH
eukprot:5538059-Amphidinium_carterae.1